MEAINAGNNAWLPLSACLALLMCVGLALFYAGMAGAKQASAAAIQVLAGFGIVTIQWAAVGYSLAFGESAFGLIGKADLAFLQGVGPDATADAVVLRSSFASFQLLFAALAPAIILGAVAGRMKLSAWCLFVLLWSTMVYAPLAHWIWNPDGWLQAAGALDFAGGAVIHLAAGFSALIAIMMLEPRSQATRPNSRLAAAAGAGLIWVGWSGLNAGAGSAADELAALVFTNSQLAAAAGLVTWMALEWTRTGKPTLLGLLAGLFAGLAAITPAAGYVRTAAAPVVGALAASLCYLAALAMARLRHADTLDIFSVHGVAGALGLLLTGVFATSAVNPAGRDGLLLGHPEQLLIQALAVLVSVVLAAAMTALILKFIDIAIGLRGSTGDDHAG